MYTPDFSVDAVVNAQAGDAAAQDRLLARLQPILRAYFIKRIGMKEEVDDLVQNTLLRVFNSLPDLVQPERFKAFAMKAALFELQDYYRGRYRGKEYLFDPDQPPHHGEKKDATGLRMDLDKALAKLTPKARRIIELREYGYQYEEIADMVGTTEAAVKMQVKRAFERLRGLLGIFFITILLHAVTLW